MPQIKLEPLGLSLYLSDRKDQSQASLLPVLQRAKVELAAVCGGKGTCGTCALRVFAGADSLSPMENLEQKTLKNTRKDVACDRLMCQTQLLQEDVVLYLDTPAQKKLLQVLQRLENRISPRNLHNPITGTLLVPSGQKITREALGHLLSEY
ncbi:MAG: 2Fe-2S iron-sulfur cluster-binding protein [Cyanobacteria bacterium P01_G01_bin.54]